MPYPRTHAGGVLVPLALAVLLPAALAGCGSAKYTYVKNSDAQAYFKVPAEWRKIDQRTLDQALGSADPASATARLNQRLSWSVAFDAHPSPSPAHLYGFGSDQPFVWARIQRLTAKQWDAISLDAMRNVLLPVTAEARQESAQGGSMLGSFELLRDESITPGHGLRGVRVTYNYALPPLAALQTFDQTAYVSDGGRLYLLLLRCSARCYLDRRGELDDIVKSFTVRNRS